MSTPAHLDQLKQFLGGLVASHEASQRAHVCVHSEPDTDHPGRTVYVVTGADKRAVEMKVAELMAECDDAEGFAHFLGPYRHREFGYWARGEIVLQQPVTVP